MNQRDRTRLVAAIERAGGLVTKADLARRWGIGAARMTELSGVASFPTPITSIGNSEVYAAVEADEWRHARGDGRPGRPRKAAA